MIVLGQMVVRIVVVTMEVIVGQFAVRKVAIAVGRMVDRRVVRLMEVFVGGIVVQVPTHLDRDRRHLDRRHLPLLREAMLMLFVQKQVI